MEEDNPKDSCLILGKEVVVVRLFTVRLTCILLAGDLTFQRHVKG
jgi:hypothetical protein